MNDSVMYEKEFGVKNVEYSLIKAENVRRGFLMKVEDKEEVRLITYYCVSKYFTNYSHADALKKTHEILSEIYYNEDPTKQPLVVHIVENSLSTGDMCITYTLDTEHYEDIPFPEDVTTKDGVLSYVSNLDCDYCSEFGYCFFQRIAHDLIRRIS